MSKQAYDYHIVIYGATGFTGRLVVEYMSKHADKDVLWAIAGRNQAALSVLNAELGIKKDILISDAQDEQALDVLTKRAKVILSCVGPYRKYGDALVAACVKNKTHYVDITGEVDWVKKQIKLHHEAAEQAGVRIVPHCGYDSIPSDLGVFIASLKFPRKLCRVKSFHDIVGGVSGGTIETAYSSPLVQKKRERVKVKKNPFLNLWTSEFMLAPINISVVRRTSLLLSRLGYPYGDSFYYQEYMVNKSGLSAYFRQTYMRFIAWIMHSPLKSWVRLLLPKPGQGPGEDVLENGMFSAVFLIDTDTDEKYVVKISAKGDPGYKNTALMVSEAAMLLAGEEVKLPGGVTFGGVLTPVTAMGKMLMDRLVKAGFYIYGPVPLEKYLKRGDQAVFPRR